MLLSKVCACKQMKRYSMCPTGPPTIYKVRHNRGKGVKYMHTVYPIR